MLIHPTHRAHPLVEPADFAAPRLPDAVAAHEPPLRTVFAWAGEYLCGPHPDLGRRGAVCPFTDTSLQRGLFYLSVHAGTPEEPDELAALLLHYRDWFAELEPKRGPGAQFKTIVILFPDLTEFGVVDRAQELLKPQYTRDGLMLGEFHPGRRRRPACGTRASARCTAPCRCWRSGTWCPPTSRSCGTTTPPWPPTSSASATACRRTCVSTCARRPTG